jgi:hypothetical protein
VPRDARVFGQMESHDPVTDTWQRPVPMPTPRHAVAAATIGGRVHVASRRVQSSVHEAFTLS